MDSMAAITSVTMKAMPAAVKARSKRGTRELPPEAKISTAKNATTAQNAENMSGPLTEVRRLRGSPGFWRATACPLVRAVDVAPARVMCTCSTASRTLLLVYGLLGALQRIVPEREAGQDPEHARDDGPSSGNTQQGVRAERNEERQGNRRPEPDDARGEPVAREDMPAPEPQAEVELGRCQKTDAEGRDDREQQAARQDHQR